MARLENCVKLSATGRQDKGQQYDEYSSSHDGNFFHLGSGCRKGHRHGCPVAYLRIDIDPAPMHLDDPVHQRQPDSVPIRFGSVVETEDLVEIIRPDSYPAIDHVGADDTITGLICCERSEEHTSELQSPLNLVCR